jgi:hypothetical protein
VSMSSATYHATGTATASGDLGQKSGLATARWAYDYGKPMRPELSKAVDEPWPRRAYPANRRLRRCDGAPTHTTTLPLATGRARRIGDAQSVANANGRHRETLLERAVGEPLAEKPSDDRPDPLGRTFGTHAFPAGDVAATFAAGEAGGV